jgi:photosystem II stability/assembly factor-like uncharacterized protein
VAPIVRLFALLIPTFLSLTLIAPVYAQDDDEATLEYRLLGPVNGGRASRVVGIPGDPLIYYLATAAGGVWKTSNGGMSWESVFDDQPVSSIGSVTLAPGNPNVVFVGSGEANIRGNVGEGNGIYRSRDAGKTWDHVWEAEGQIGTIVVSPSNDDVIFAAALGSPFGAGPDRGVYRSTDGGDSWEKVLYIDEDTGASDVAFDENNPNILFAGMWQTRRYPWDMVSGGPGSGLYMSRDGGDTWDELEGSGLPEGIWGKVGVRVAATDSNRVYALIEAEDGGLFRSDDGGSSWDHISDSAGLKQRAWYYSTLTIDPTNKNLVWFPQVSMQKTIDGGKTVLRATAGGWDHHDIWIDPKNPKRIADASDGGVGLSLDGGESWEMARIPLGQFYHLTVDTRTPYRVMGSLQDFGTRAGPSNSLHGGGIHLSDWRSVGGGEAGYVAPDPEDPNIVYAGEYLGYLSRYNELTGQAPHVGIYPDNGSGHGAEDLRHRFQWTAPIMISPHDSKLVYHASNYLQRTNDGGQSWDIISPDLTRDDKSKQKWAGGPITGDNTGVEFYGTIFSVAESSLERGVIWTGSDDGLIHITRDDGETWDNVTPKGAPEWGTVVTIEASRFDAGTAYVVFDAHRLDDETPYIWKTTNYGYTWIDITRGLDDEIYLKVVREDTKKKGLLFLGTERGVMVSHDGGTRWESLRLNMPTVAIADIAVAGDDLVIGSLGRAAWILDDLTPIREMSNDIADANAHLFKPLDAIRWSYGSSPEGGDAGSTSNPAAGASFTYYLSEEPEDDISVLILDTDGNVIRTLSSEMEAPYLADDHPDARPGQKASADLTKVKGMNRGSWDLAYEGATLIPDSTNDAGNPDSGPVVAPGDYQLQLIVGEDTYEQALTVAPDPRSDASVENILAQTEFMLSIRDRLSELSVDAVRIRSIKAQLDAHAERLGDDSRMERLLEIGAETSAALEEVEHALYSPDAEVNYDILGGRQGGAKLYSRFGWLYNTTLDHSGPPTQGSVEVNAELSALHDQAKAELERILDEDIQRLNSLAGELGVRYIEY